MSETVRINSLISDEEKKINNIYCQIGTRYVYVHGMDCGEEFLGMVNSILDFQHKRKEYQYQIQNFKEFKDAKSSEQKMIKELYFL